MQRRNSFTSVAATLLLCTVLLASAVPISAAPCTGQITGNRFYECRNLNQLIPLMPCGITNLAACDLDTDPCGFSLGSLVESDFIVVEWETLINKNQPPANQCTALANSVDPCGGWGPLIDCPSELISEEEDPCGPDQPFCFSAARATATEKVAAAWGETCHAYALMPRGWDEWTAARGFFTVGRTFPLEALARQGEAENEIYGAEQALADGLLGPTLLGLVGGRSPLWGGGRDGAVQTDHKALRSVGLCANPQGALLASPYWETPNAGVANFPVLARCDGAAVSGLDLYIGKDSQTGIAMDDISWQESGVLSSDVLERLERLERRGRYEVVCVTPESADERRALRQLGQGPQNQR